MIFFLPEDVFTILVSVVYLSFGKSSGSPAPAPKTLAIPETKMATIKICFISVVCA